MVQEEEYIKTELQKMKKKALNMAISQRVSEESVFVIDGTNMETPSTKEAGSLNQLGINNTFTFVYSDGDENLIKSLRNIEKAELYLLISWQLLMLSQQTILFFQSHLWNNLLGTNNEVFRRRFISSNF